MVLVGMFAIGLLVRVWLAQNQWIDPDEGAHLMDARLALDGLVPAVDFGGRQPLYVYATALFATLLGASVFHVRLFPVFASLMTGALVFLIARRLLDRRAAMIAAALFLLLPFSVVHSTQTKTGPLTMCLSAGAVYCFVLSSGRPRPAALLALAGALSALAFYVRQSTLAIPVALGLALLLQYRTAPIRALRTGTSLALGFTAVCLVVAGLYLAVLSPGGIWRSAELNPLGFVVGKLTGSPSPAEPPPHEAADPQVRPEGPGSPPEERSDQPWTETRRMLSLTASLNASLVAIALLSLVALPLVPPLGTHGRQGILVLYLWVLLLAAAYGFWTITRGFFPAYFSELVPPLAILAGYFVSASIHELDDDRGGQTLLVIGMLGAAVFAAHSLFPLPSLPKPAYFVIPTTGLALAYVLRRATRARAALAVSALAVASVVVMQAGAKLTALPKYALYLALVPTAYVVIFTAGGWTSLTARRRRLGFMGLSLAVSALAWSLAQDGGIIDTRFAGLWSPGTVGKAAAHLRSNGRPTDEVMSGAVIWEFEAGMHTFMNYSHPLALQSGIPQPLKTEMEMRLRESPPAFIVLDGYTQRTYLRHLPMVAELLATRYSRTLVLELDSPFPVEVFQRSDLARPGGTLTPESRGR